MSNDETNQRRRLVEMLAATNANANVTAIQDAASTANQANTVASAARLQAANSPPSNSAASAADLATMVRLRSMMGDSHSVLDQSLQVPGLGLNQGNPNLAALLALNHAAPAPQDAALARLFSANAAQEQMDLRRLLHPEAAANNTSSILSLLGPGGLAGQNTPLAAPPSSTETAIALLNAGVPSSQIVQLLQTQRPSNDIETLLRYRLARDNAAAASASVEQQQLLQQLMGTASASQAPLPGLLGQQQPGSQFQHMSQQLLMAPSVSGSKKGSDKKSTGKRKEPPAAANPPLRKAPKGMTGHAPELLYMSSDEERLSAYHVLARKHIEFFEASEEDTSTNARGRNRPIVLGQVGIRCRHCSSIPPRRRQRAAMYYPFKLDLLYQACQTLTNVHLCEQCTHIPKEVREQLVKLREEKTTALVGKKYWADGARQCGIYETEDGMRFEAPAKKEEGSPDAAGAAEDATAAKKAKTEQEV